MRRFEFVMVIMRFELLSNFQLFDRIEEVVRIMVSALLTVRSMGLVVEG